MSMFCLTSLTISPFSTRQINNHVSVSLYVLLFGRHSVCRLEVFLSSHFRNGNGVVVCHGMTPHGRTSNHSRSLALDIPWCGWKFLRIRKTRHMCCIWNFILEVSFLGSDWAFWIQPQIYNWDSFQSEATTHLYNDCILLSHNRRILLAPMPHSGRWYKWIRIEFFRWWTLRLKVRLISGHRRSQESCWFAFKSKSSQVENQLQIFNAYPAF